MDDRTPWLDWAMELQAHAQAGLTYSTNPFERERYERIRQIAAEMVAHQGDIPPEKAKELFCAGSGYPTPKLDTRAAIFREGKILLVRERSGRWSLPGGWVDAWLSVGENAVKEVREEAGLEARAEFLIAVQDRDKHNPPRYAVKVCKVFVMCTALGGTFQENIETTASGWFGIEELPPLAVEKNTAEQIRMCFEARDAEHWQTRFD